MENLNGQFKKKEYKVAFSHKDTVISYSIQDKQWQENKNKQKQKDEKNKDTCGS